MDLFELSKYLFINQLCMLVPATELLYVTVNYVDLTILFMNFLL